MKMQISFRFRTAFVVIGMITCCLSTCESMRVPKPVILNKCCRLNEHMTEDATCVFGESENWWPLITMILKQRFFEPIGQSPPFMRARERSLPDCNRRRLIFGPNKVALFSNGSLLLPEVNRVVNIDDFCIDKEAALVCDSISMKLQTADSMMNSVPKVRKCCGGSAVYMKKAETCTIIHPNSTILQRSLIKNSSNVNFIYGFPVCHSQTNHFAMAHQFQFDFTQANITLDSGRQFTSNQYCLEHSVEDENGVAQTIVFTCAEDMTGGESAHMDIRFILFPAGLLTSVVFLMVTLVLGFLLPNHHLLHWRCQTFYISCLLIGDLLLAFTQFSKIFNLNHGNTCVPIAICMHFFFLSAFFWLNTMCVNIWWTFRDFRPSSLEKGQESLRLRFYKIYAFGVPLLIAGIAAYTDYRRKNYNTDTFLLPPRYCEVEYWFGGDVEKLTYFYGPVGFLLILNFLLFASTARQLTCGLWKREEVKSSTERATLGRICLKLVIVMGVTWIADVLSWAFGGSYYYWIVTDLINVLQGVFIFLVIACQPHVSVAVKRFWSSRSLRTTMTGTHEPRNSSSSSQDTPYGGELTSTQNKIPMETLN